MEKEKLMEKRYGLPTALSMVVGIVIGSGIFFKAVKLLNLTHGSMKDALLVIGAVGVICVVFMRDIFIGLHIYINVGSNLVIIQNGFNIVLFKKMTQFANVTYWNFQCVEKFGKLPMRSAVYIFKFIIFYSVFVHDYFLP